MIFINLDSTDPFFNLAAEEYIFNNKNYGEDYFILWQNSNTIVVGKYQNTIDEINEEFVRLHKINVVRRLSGGGAVYHDLGNINYTFITSNKNINEIDFSKFILPVIKALKNMGLNAEYNSRNDITIEGKKISGNSQYIKNNKILHHGTLLFDSNMNIMEKALNVKPNKIESKGIKSIRSRVGNITEFFNDTMDICSFKKLLLFYLFQENYIKEYFLTKDDIAKINQIKKEKYVTWDWNYGNSPDYNIKKEKKFDFGFIVCLIKVEDDNNIANIKFYGDFFGYGDILEFEKCFINKKLRIEDITSILEGIDVENYISGLDKNKFIALLF